MTNESRERTGRRPWALIVGIVLVVGAVATAGIYWWTEGRYRGKGETMPTLVDTSVPDEMGGVRAEAGVSLRGGGGVEEEGDERLIIRLSEGEAQYQAPEPLPVAAGQPLSEEEIARILARLPELGLEPQDQVDFRLPEGVYNFRADYFDNQYFSGNTTVIAHNDNPISISTGGGAFTLTVEKGAGVPLKGVTCYLFSASGSYLGHQTATNDQGEASFDLADGDYQIRIDYETVFTVHKYRPCSHHHNGADRGDKCRWGGNHFIPVTNPQNLQRHGQGVGAGPDTYGMGRFT